MRNLNVLLLVLIVGLFLPSETRSQTNRDSKENLIVASVRSYLGTPYRYGGTSRQGIDCSGLIYVTYNTGGVEIPREAREQSKVGKTIKWNRLKPGDLVFFKFKQKGEKWYHSGVVSSVEKNQIRFIHSSSSKGVIESDLLSDYYRENVKIFKRVI